MCALGTGVQTCALPIAMLMMSWFDDPHRGTRDLDLLGFGDPSEAAMLATFRDILAQDAEDGVVFDPDTLRVDRIREELDYGGLRLRAIRSEARGEGKGCVRPCRYRW